MGEVGLEDAGVGGDVQGSEPLVTTNGVQYNDPQITKAENPSLRVDMEARRLL